eukprot:3772648-Pleurochrysis_carterae.AAC.8
MARPIADAKATLFTSSFNACPAIDWRRRAREAHRLAALAGDDPPADGWIRRAGAPLSAALKRLAASTPGRLHFHTGAVSLLLFRRA